MWNAIIRNKVNSFIHLRKVIRMCDAPREVSIKGGWIFNGIVASSKYIMEIVDP